MLSFVVYRHFVKKKDKLILLIYLLILNLIIIINIIYLSNYPSSMYN